MKITILTGAGISAESGLGTFRSTDGLWAKYDLAKVATPEAFNRDPAMVHEFYNLRRKACIEAQPNPAHFALAELQRASPNVTIVTQNVDDLHERAGAKVLHMHGELMRARCVKCDRRWEAPVRMSAGDLCDCGAAARPDVVWFGESPYFIEEITHAVRGSDLFVVIGSSGKVYPAAGFVQIADKARVDTLEINLERNGQVFDRSIVGPATQTVPEWVRGLI
ncbi:NAD-dependent deacylase [Cereibacter sp. SYSU M97828]|nr:NAD-dependent deacylase [Cereibacter flavus]